jgi:hypothetical protein
MTNMTDEEVIQLALRIAIAEEEKMLEVLRDTDCNFTKADIESNLANFKRLQK